MHSRLTLSTQLTSSGRTQLKDSFVSPPFKLMTLPHQGHVLEAIQMSSSPGLLAGDKLHIDIHLAAETELSLRTQAYTRVQSMNKGEWAEQHTHIFLKRGCRISYLPHPLVLHKDSSLKQTTIVEMEEGSQLIYGDIVAIGRVLNQERFAFEQFSSYLRVSFQGKPLLSDRIQWLPRHMPLTALSQMEDYSHQGTFVYMNLAVAPSVLKERVQAIQSHYSQQMECMVGTSLLDQGGFLVRATAYRADTLEKLFTELSSSLLYPA